MITLSDFVGNEQIKQQIKTMAENGRLPHAVILEGDALSGRKTLARIIAAMAACSGNHPPCGHCAACRSEQNPDISVICPNEKGLIPVDVIRKIRSDAYILPNHSARRVFVIDDAHKMNVNGQNALLKVIEEPPKSVMFIFVCDYAQQLLETVRSRCVIVHICLPSEQEAERYIGDHYDYDPLDVTTEVRRSGGNIGIALNRLRGDGGYEKIAGEIALKSTESELEMLKSFVPYERDVQALKKITEGLLSIYHSALLAKQGMIRDEETARLAKHMTAPQLFSAGSACRKALEDFESVIPLTAADGALYVTNLCTCICAALGL